MDGIHTTLHKFDDPLWTVKGDQRAHVDYRGTKTLWFNTGTLCNIECANCYIESSPSNDRLVYLTLDDITPYLDELDAAGERQIEIGFTGGEPFMAPEILEMINAVLVRGHSVLILTNAMKPMMRKRVQAGIKALAHLYKDKLTFRVSLDHFTADHHDAERGAGSFDSALIGLQWLSAQEISLAIAGRSLWNENENEARAGYRQLFESLDISVDCDDPSSLVLFPEMANTDDPPEISTACWDILSKDPGDVMCASQRMVVRRRSAKSATVTACTLLPYDERFELGQTLSEARQSVSLNHPWCATFCVLGGGSCSA